MPLNTKKVVPYRWKVSKDSSLTTVFFKADGKYYEAWIRSFSSPAVVEINGCEANKGYIREVIDDCFEGGNLTPFEKKNYFPTSLYLYIYHWREHHKEEIEKARDNYPIDIWNKTTI